MNCKEVENNLIFYIEGELDTNFSKKLNAHLKTCSSCNALYKNMKADMDFLSKDKALQTNPFFYQRLEQKIKNNNKENSKNNIKQLYIQALTYAAAIIIAVFIGVALGKDYQITDEFAMEEDAQISEFQLFAESYSVDMSSEDSYEIIISDNE
ncbi:MAG: zf-HC2 domain-containing protein [Bacteroidales bacterium]|nr:zf-HC2 domain-containing protein [Bacteroidales bacterium]